MNTDAAVNQPPPAAPDTRTLLRRRALQLGAIVVLQGAILFVGSGRMGWAAGWVYLATYVAMIALTRLVVRDPELFAERARMPKDAKAWDKVLSTAAGLAGLAVVLVAAIEVRFGWSEPLPVPIQAAGFAAFVLGFGFAIWAMASNRYFSAVVRIQVDRGHTVAAGGPYAFVRHPAYVGFLVGNLATALLLGSRWALVPVALTGLLIVARTALEDRTLRNELKGYADYAARVRYRLLPGVW
jgi:protein-S-isoprenylcysteine O-methyltransferase Ste14